MDPESSEEPTRILRRLVKELKFDQILQIVPRFASIFNIPNLLPLMFVRLTFNQYPPVVHRNPIIVTNIRLQSVPPLFYLIFYFLFCFMMYLFLFLIVSMLLIGNIRKPFILEIFKCATFQCVLYTS